MLEIRVAHGGNLIQSGHKRPTSVESRSRGASVQKSAGKRPNRAVWCRGCKRGVGHFRRGGWIPITAERAEMNNGASGSSIPRYFPSLMRIQHQQIPDTSPQNTLRYKEKSGWRSPSKAVVILPFLAELFGRCLCVR